ncbi:MAG: YerC/YecD family TrpR-related protein [Candidatus Izemoplasmatales bacterium]|nr:YerC/YecD family TrpR-related protein [Candidatus Izemoplasmatales bacterium]
MSYRSKFGSDDIELLFDAILKLKDKEECYRFFEDLCTIKEIQDMGQRMRVVKMLDAGVPYQAISLQTHASTATISRVNKSLHYGADGYRMVLEKLKDKQ